jgi:3'-phosphoadenosine 5'-phosphosulfate sulfotransferase (PAPS reductase)/FAD synthetase
MRTPDELNESALAVIERAYCGGAYRAAPLFSGGHDSECAVYVASQHRSFQGHVHFINTTIGSNYTRLHVQRVCDKYGWKLIVHQSNESYEKIVSDHGFPGPGGHQYVYNRLKDRCIYQITKGSRAFRNATMLINGSRSQESVRRMGHVAAIQMGEVCKKKTGSKRRNLNRVWTAPCHDWSKAEQVAFMDEFGLSINKVKVALGLSGECFCGAFASPGEREAIKEHVPDVEVEIARLTEIAVACGKPCVWGQRPAGKVAVGTTGPMCSGCDRRAAATGIQIVTA